MVENIYKHYYLVVFDFLAEHEDKNFVNKVD